MRETMTENIIFRCEVSTDARNVHVKTTHGEKLDLIDMMIAHAFTAAIIKTTDAIKVVLLMGRC